MLLNENLLDLISLHLRVLKIFGPYPFKLDKLSRVLSSADNKNVLPTKVTISLLLTIAILTWAQLWLSRGNVSTVVTYEGMIYAASDVTFVVTGYVYLVRQRDVIELFNLVCNFERRYYNSGRLKHNLGS